MAKKTLEQPQKQHHPSRDHTGRFPIDAALREQGYRIYSRMRGQEAHWIYDGNVYPQSILEKKYKTELKHARLEQDDYFFRFWGVSP